MVRLLMAIITWNAEETFFCNKEFILLEKVHCSFVWLVARQKILLPIITMKMSDLFDYAIRDIMKKILY